MKKLLCLVLLSFICTLFTGCATAMKGTERKVYAWFNGPGPAYGTLKTESQETTLRLPNTFTMSTKDDWGKMTLTATNSQGQTITLPLGWESKYNGTMYGGAGIMTAVFGVFGPISLIVDIYNHANKEVTQNTVMFDFESLSASNNAYNVVNNNAAVTPKKPCPELGSGKKTWVINPQ